MPITTYAKEYYQKELVAGDNVIMSTASGQPTTVSAVNTTYTTFTSTQEGLVPPPTTAVDMFLKSDGTWAEAGGGGVGNVIDVYENGVSVLDENNIAQTHSYKEITQAEYDALYPPGSTVTDNILYAIKDGEGGGGSSGGGNVDDVYVNGISVLDSNHIAQIKTHKEITASDYNELTTEQKNDGTLYLINGTSGITVPVEDISIGKYIESAYVCQDEVTEDGTGVISYYYGNSQIGNDFWLLDKVDVTNYTYIKYDLELGTCYGTSSANWYYTVGLMDSVPNDWIYAGDSRYVVKNSYTSQEISYADETLDVSTLTGEYYIIVVAHGWNATFNNIRLVSEDVQPNRIYFMDTEFGNNGGGGSALNSGIIRETIWTGAVKNPNDSGILDKAISNYDYILVYGHPTDVTYEYHLDLLDVSCLLDGIANNSGFFSYEYYDTYYCRCKFLDETHFSCTQRAGGGSSYYEFTKMVGIKIQNNSGSSSNTLLYQGDGVSNSSQITLNDDYTNYDMLIIRTLRIADGRTYKTDKTFNVLGLSNNDFIQDIGWNPDNNYWTYQISSSTILSKIAEGYNYFLYEIYGVKL